MVRKIIRSVIAGAGAAGALALLNRGLATALPISHLPGTARPWTWRGNEIFTTESGEGRPIVLIHGIAPGASSSEFRALFPLLARRGRAIALDLIGCGLSQKPRLDYAADLFADQIVDALRELAGGPAIVVASSLGAAFAIRAAVRAPELVARLVAICPSAGTEERGPASALLQAPVLGESLYNVLASKIALRRYLEREAYGDPQHVTADIVNDVYAIAHQPGAHFVIGAMLAGKLDSEVARDLPFVEAPVLILWGKRARTNPARNAREYAELAKHGEVEYYVKSALMPHAEEAEAVAERILAFA